jgi:hypothetical protein
MHMSNANGQAYAFMAVTPILPGAESALLEHLAALPTGEASPLARMGSTHFARWLVLDDLVYEGPPQERDTLQSSYLFFVSNFDGDLDPYLEAMLEHMPAEAEALWSCCVGFPGIEDRASFKAYLRHNQLNTTFFVSAYPDATVDDVRRNLALRQRVSNFAIAAQGLDSSSLRQAWDQEFAQAGA